MGLPSSGPSKIWGNGGEILAILEKADDTQSARRAARGSAGLDLCATTRLVLTPQMGLQLVHSDFKGRLPEGTVGLLIGRRSTTKQGVIVHPGVIDSGYTGIVKIMVSSPRGIAAISPGDRIAQLLVLPSCHLCSP
ncbi:deoxyuridine 5'-triphosphate nucleotidohydrolase-like [Arvicanthis niloticus]|uniref:deoxyuridine 5'-triphosphate nucleotidohydrolase-like n=1 Tax=Arvicanthis niloticus TaxID=61156 RepID=UPI00402BE7AC